MKVRAARAVRDADDVRVLLRELKLTKVAQVKKIVEKYFADEPMSARSLALIEEILNE